MNIFLAGASGVIGRRLVPLLRDAGHSVTGITRSNEKAMALAALGARGLVIDVYDARALALAMHGMHPEIVIHQMTDLPASNDPAKIAGSREANARLRIEGTRNLMAAAVMAGARRVVAQSIAFIYAPGEGARVETDPLDTSPQQATTIRGVMALEDQVMNTREIEGVVLRYGRLYGPGTWAPSAPMGPGSLHVDAAAQAALVAVTRGRGIYNIAEDDGAFSIERAKSELGFDPHFRIW